MATFDIGNPQPFIYNCLSDAKTCIRILEILPGNDTCPLKCTLQETPLENRYNCLSYTWGTDGASHSILINDKVFFVRDNLWAFLVEARRTWTDESLPLWIDAICIDQKNGQEKNIQVASMGEIYAHATTVLSWLGENNPLIEAAFDFIATNGFGDLDFRTNSYRFWARFESFGKDLKQYWDAFDAIASLEYWNRMWIVQEVLRAQYIVLQYGCKTTSIRNLENVVQIIQSGSGPLGSTLINGYSKLQQSACGIIIVRRCRESKRTPYPAYNYFLQTVREFRLHECQDKRDKIYAILSLGYEHLNIAVEYEASIISIAISVWEKVLYDYFPIEDGFLLMKSLGICTVDYLKCKQPYFLSRYWNEKISCIATVKLAEESPQLLQQTSELWEIDETTLGSLGLTFDPVWAFHQFYIQTDKICSSPVLRENDILVSFVQLNFFLAFRRSNSGEHMHEQAALERIKYKHGERTRNKLGSKDFDSLAAILQEYECIALLSFPIEDELRSRIVGSGRILEIYRKELPLILTPRYVLDLKARLQELRLTLHQQTHDSTGPSIRLRVDWATLLELWKMLEDDDDLFHHQFPTQEKIGSWDEECAKVNL